MSIACNEVIATKDVFTAGQAARICRVAPQTIVKWFDTGKLEGFRIPGGRDRRIPRDSLIQFLLKHGLPLGELEDHAFRKVLAVGLDTLTQMVFQEALTEAHHYRLETAESVFDAGIKAATFRPTVVMVDLAIGRLESGQIAQALRGEGLTRGVCLIAIGAFERVRDQGYDGSIDRPIKGEGRALMNEIQTIWERCHP